ncbi:family A1 protease [Phellopilus nigrolimitatus]|nr:family A1 protease [Phellopilus nigrolimitatus]
MAIKSSFLVVALIALSVSATPAAQIREPNVSLPFVRRLNVSGSTLADKDRARAAHIISTSRARSGTNKKRASSFDVTNAATTYVASIGVGSPATTYSLLIDTGSSNTWVGAGKAFVETSTSKETDNLMEVTYGSGFFLGIEFTDTVTLTEDLVITGQDIGVAEFSEGFEGVDGIIGIGPVDLTAGTVSDGSTVPTVTDNLLSQGTISTEVIGVSFAPTQSDSITNGELTFGGTDPSKFTGSISFFPITTTSPSSEFWGIDQSITYGSANTTVLSSTAGVVDTGTTLVLIATNAFDTYTSLTGATLDDSVGLLSISSADYANLESLFFNVGDSAFELTKNAQTWPRALNTAIGGAASDIFLIVGDIGTDSGEGLDFINGFTFLERFYSVFDTTNNRVGFATTEHTEDTSN